MNVLWMLLMAGLALRMWRFPPTFLFHRVWIWSFPAVGMLGMTDFVFVMGS